MPRPDRCENCGKPMHSATTRADDRPPNSVLYRGKGLCTECAPPRATSGSFGKFQMRPSHLITNTTEEDQS